MGRPPEICRGRGVVLAGNLGSDPLQRRHLLRCGRQKAGVRILNIHPHSPPGPPDYGKVDLVRYDDREYQRWSEGFAFRRRRERQRTGKVRIEPAALSIISAAAEIGVRSILSRHFHLGDRRIIRYQDPEHGDQLRGRHRFRELDAVAFSGDKATAVFEFKLSGLGSASAVSRAAKQLRSAAEMIRQGYGHTPKIAVVLIHAGEGHPDLGKPGGRFGVRATRLEGSSLAHLPEQPIPCFVFTMREAIEEARRIGHEVDEKLEKEPLARASMASLRENEAFFPACRSGRFFPRWDDSPGDLSRLPEKSPASYAAAVPHTSPIIGADTGAGADAVKRLLRVDVADRDALPSE